MQPFIHHVSLLTKNSSDNQRFYIDFLGLRFVKHTVNQDNHRMIHDYYGNYYGAPGSVITFFIVPLLGHRYDNAHSLQTIGLKIPKGSLLFWKNRLKTAGISYNQEKQTLIFQDKDEVVIYLTETDQPPLEKKYQVDSTDIPPEKQILGLMSTEFHVEDPQLTIDFFQQFLNWKTENNRVLLNDIDFIDIFPSEQKEKTRMGRGSMDHVAFAVENDVALDLLYEKAKKQGWLIEKIVNRGYFRSLYIREPGGNRVEFATLSPGFTIDEPLERLGETLALPPFLQNQRSDIEAAIYKEK